MHCSVNTRFTPIKTVESTTVVFRHSIVESVSGRLTIIRKKTIYDRIVRWLAVSSVCSRFRRFLEEICGEKNINIRLHTYRCWLAFDFRATGVVFRVKRSAAIIWATHSARYSRVCDTVDDNTVNRTHVFGISYRPINVFFYCVFTSCSLVQNGPNTICDYNRHDTRVVYARI